MEKLSQFLKQKSFKKTVLDEKTVFYVFKKIVGQEYGNRGRESLFPEAYKNRKLFIKAQSSVWASETWANRNVLIKKINQQLGANEVQGIKISK